MTEPIRFRVPGQPIAKGRPRAFRTASGVRMHTPGRTVAYEAAVGLAARAAGVVPVDGPLSMEVVIVLARPARLCRKFDPPGRLWAPVKPDADNVVKAVSDGLVKAGCLHDDAPIVYVTAWKHYAAIGEEPHVAVTLGPVGAP